jgi:hypothetical protein
LRGDDARVVDEQRETTKLAIDGCKQALDVGLPRDVGAYRDRGRAGGTQRGKRGIRRGLIRAVRDRHRIAALREPEGGCGTDPPAASRHECDRLCNHASSFAGFREAANGTRAPAN